MRQHRNTMTSEARSPLVSVIVLGWNGREFLSDCLGSVLDQDLPSSEYEVLYVDNGSRDGSSEFVRTRFPDVPVLALERNFGYAEGNNIGFRDTRGEFVVFLNQDTVAHRSWLRELVGGVRSTPDIRAAHANVIQPWYPEHEGLERWAPASSAYTAELNRFGYAKYRKLESVSGPVDVLFLHGVSIIIHRSVVDELGYIFDPEFFAYAEDMDLGLRIRALGYRCVVIPAAVVYHKHRLKTDLSWATFVKTVRIIRNRYLAFYKVMALPEFALMSTLLTLGSPLNAGEFGLHPVARIIYGIGLLPVTLVSLVVTLWHLPRFAAKRREVRARTARPGAWCLRAVWNGVAASRPPNARLRPDSSP